MFAHGANPDGALAPRTRPAAPAVHGSSPVSRESATPVSRAVRPHSLPRGFEQGSKSLVVELTHLFPRVDPRAPQGLAPIDVADAGDHALVKQHLTDRSSVEFPRSADCFGERPVLRQDVRTKMAHA